MQGSRPAGFALAVMIEAKKEIPLSFLLATSIVLMNLPSPSSRFRVGQIGAESVLPVDLYEIEW